MIAKRLDEVLDRLTDGSWMCRHCGNFEWSLSVEVCPRCKRSQGDPTPEEQAEYEQQWQDGFNAHCRRFMEDGEE